MSDCITCFTRSCTHTKKQERNEGIFKEYTGLVAQLNSASDYGSEGYRFESCRGHFYKS